MRQKIVLYMKK